MPQSSLLIGAGALTLLVLAVIFVYVRRTRRELPYLADDFLFSPEQLAFKRVLDEAAGDSCAVYGQIRVADVIGVRAGVSRREFDRAYARVGERCFDFLICERRTAAILCAVNLVRRARTTGPLPQDALDEVCQAAQLPFLRIPEEDGYDPEAISAAIRDALRPAPSRPEKRVPVRERIDDSEELALLRELSQSIVGESPTPRPETSATASRTARPTARPSLVKAVVQVAQDVVDVDLDDEQHGRSIRRISARR